MTTLSLSIIIPVYNETVDVVSQTISACASELSSYPHATIIVVNDGSSSTYNLDSLKTRDDIIYKAHEINRGYGSALKTGILAHNSDLIGIIDADGTYPINRLLELAQLAANFDMVIGCRTGKIRQIPFIRRFPKFVLNRFASYIAGNRIDDLNSGMRIFRRDLAYYLWSFYPSGFSFTSTITLGALLNGYRIKNISIDYYKRQGKSAIKPIKDTILFFRLVFRLGLIFAPIKLFRIYALLLFLVGFIKGIVIDYIQLQHIGNFATIMIVSSIQVFMIGLVAQLIVHNRYVRPPKQLPSASVPTETSSSHVSP